MLYWVFNEEQLERAQAAFVANSAAHDMTPTQAIHACAYVTAFLTSIEARENKLIGGE